MPRVLIAECKQEVSTFNPHLSRGEDFVLRHGEEMLHYHRRVRNEVGGALAVFASEPGVAVVPAASAIAITSGGTLAAPDWHRLAGDWLTAIAAAGPVDAACFCLHGAMAAEDEPDPEGHLLAEARRHLGDRVPIVVSLDLHGVLTERMLEHSDAIVAYHTYPHVDFYETGARAARLLLRLQRGGVRPVTARVAIPALVRGEELLTATGRFGQCIARARTIENGPRGLSAGLFIANPFTDVPALQCTSFVVSDDDPALAEREALALAREFWAHHERMQVPLVSLAAAARIAAEAAGTGGTVALVDAADAPSSGASGDGNAILRALFETGYRGRVLAPIVDAPAVRHAFAAGIGATVTVPVGGTLDPARFAPLPITGTVRLLADGRFRSESFGEEWHAGPTAVLEGTGFILAHGQDPRQFDAVVVKSPYCQHHMFASWCSRLIDVDGPGSTSANLRRLGHTRCPRPIFPLDPDVPFAPRATLFHAPAARARGSSLP